jgi:hypothetical protein
MSNFCEKGNGCLKRKDKEDEKRKGVEEKERGEREKEMFGCENRNVVTERNKVR